MDHAPETLRRSQQTRSIWSAVLVLLGVSVLGCYIGGEPPQSCKQESVGDAELLIENQLSSGLQVSMEDGGNVEPRQVFLLAPGSCEIHALPVADWQVELSQCDWSGAGRCEAFGPVLEGSIDVEPGQSRTLEVPPSAFGL